MDRITIIGMGPIGVSIGLGLKQAGLVSTEVVGVDRDREALSKASKIGAIDRRTGNLSSALDGAQLVILDVPLAETRELLEGIGPGLEKGCVVTDTATAKVRVTEWAESSLPGGVSFVGGHPLLARPVSSLDDAEARLFEGTNYCVIPAESADAESVKTVVGMVESLGASPLFLGAHEHDSYVAAVAHLPLVLSSAIVASTTASKSWRDMSRLAGPEFRDISHWAANDPQDSAAVCLANADALVHWLDKLIAELSSYRDQVKQGDDNLLDKFVGAWEQHARWEAGAVVEDNRVEVPSAAQTMGGMVLGSRLTERYRQITGAKKRPQWKYPQSD